MFVETELLISKCLLAQVVFSGIACTKFVYYFIISNTNVYLSLLNIYYMQGIYTQAVTLLFVLQALA